MRTILEKMEKAALDTNKEGGRLAEVHISPRTMQTLLAELGLPQDCVHGLELVLAGSPYTTKVKLLTFDYDGIVFTTDFRGWGNW